MGKDRKGILRYETSKKEVDGEMLKADYRTSCRQSGGFSFLVYFNERRMAEGGDGRLRSRQLLQTEGIKGEND